MSHSNNAITWRPSVILMLSLVAAWLLWSGLYKPLLLLLGLVSCLLCYWLAKRTHYFDESLFPLRFSTRLLHFWWWLLIEIVRSSLQVVRIVFHPRLPISPRIIELRSRSAHPFDQVILANSITLTPGTLAMDVHEGVIKVHSLTEQSAQDLLADEMNQRVANIHKG